MGRKDNKGGAQTARLDERAPRNKTLLVASCERADGSVVALTVLDLSASGFKARCPGLGHIDVGEPVRVTFPNMKPIVAQIARLSDERLGISFVRPVDPARIAVARHAPVVSPRAAAVDRWIHEDAPLLNQEPVKQARPV